jgi:SNF2 family DNA or RNA helicase
MLKLIETALEERKIKYALLTGQTKKRKEVVNAFQEDDEIRVFLISLKAGGMGLNLTQADYVYLMDPWWNPAVENQAIDRAYRIGQDKKVVAVRFITPNTIEEKILELQKRKQELVGDLVHTDVSTLKQLNRKELIDLL